MTQINIAEVSFWRKKIKRQRQIIPKQHDVLTMIA